MGIDEETKSFDKAVPRSPALDSGIAV